MNSGITMQNVDIAENSSFTDIYRSNTLYRESVPDRFEAEHNEEIGQDLMNYLDRLGLGNESGLLVIPSMHHYFYDAEDLRGVRTVVNLKQLNHVREIRNFLRRVSDLMPHRGNFVGCFVDNENQNGFSDKYSNLPKHLSEKAEAYENGIESRIPFINRMYSFIDARTNRYLTRRSVVRLLEECGLQLVGMTELNGLTYFCTQKVKPAA